MLPLKSSYWGTVKGNAWREEGKESNRKFTSPQYLHRVAASTTKPNVEILQCRYPLQQHQSLEFLNIFEKHYPLGHFLNIQCKGLDFFSQIQGQEVLSFLP